MSQLPACVAISPDVLFQELDGESVLLNLRNDRYYGLDDVGTRMWQLLAEHGTVETVIRNLLAEYRMGPVDEATVRHDLGELISKLAAAGLIRLEPAE